MLLLVYDNACSMMVHITCDVTSSRTMVGPRLSILFPQDTRVATADTVKTITQVSELPTPVRYQPPAHIPFVQSIFMISRFEHSLSSPITSYVHWVEHV